jgi:outer membrane protein assembly factor BamB
MRTAATFAVSCTALLVAGCADSLPSLPKFSDINPFAEKQVPLAGKRIPIMEATGSIGELAAADRPVYVPAPIANDSWPQPGGKPNNAPGNVALNAQIKQVWSADAGTGSSKTGRLTASPIVFDGRVYTLDATARVSAFALSGGSAVWRTSLMPDKEAGSLFSWSSGGGGGYGGGLAADAGRVFAATGFGSVVALDAQTGKKLWEKSVETPIRSAPTATADRVFVITSDGRFFALAASDGNELWSSRALPEQAFLISSASPAVEGDVVVAPFPSGEVIAMRVGTGQTIWSESLTRTRSGTADASMSNAARPAIDGGMVFAVGHGGRMVATSLRNGERVWNINLASTQPPAVVGEAIYVVDAGGQLRALSRRDGSALWTVKLPGSATWSGPTAAGNALWLVSKEGNLVAADAATGRIVSQQSLGYPVFIAPIVAQGRMLIVTDSARLIAFN